MRNWDEQSELEQLAQIYSDQYKDINGFRPGDGVGHPETVEEYREACDIQSARIHTIIKEERRRESIAYGEWKVNIRKIMGLCSCSKAEAIKIDIDANGAMWPMDESTFVNQEYAIHQNVEEYIWKLGIGYDKQTEIEGLLNAT